MNNQTQDPKLQELKTRLLEVNDLRSASSLLHWDQATYMPSGGAAARGRQMSTLNRLAHEKFTDGAIGQLLEDLRPYEESLSFDSDEASLIRATRRDYEEAVKVPAEFEARFSDHIAAIYQDWTAARPNNDFKAVQPLLEKTLDFSRELADFFPGYEHIADPLINFSDRGMKASTVRALFADLRQQLVPLVEAITAQPKTDESCLHGHWPEAEQFTFGRKIIKAYGYDFERGRQDKTHHPFMTKFSLGDVRITTRAKEDDLAEALFSTLHESGHALYEQGINQDYEGTPLANGTSSGVHESQSRLWENIVGRSRGFWNHWYPLLQQANSNLSNVSQDTFYRAINRVDRSLIRTDADEVTYNLHVMIRFDLELQLLEGELSVRDLPEAWHERYKSDLGLTAPDDRDGVLQDVHWYGGTIGGAFQGYTLGNILSAQFFDTATAAQPKVPQEIEQGQFSTLHEWLQENIYQHGSKYTAPELIERVTGDPLSIEPYLRYLRGKYGELYSL
ncbi:MAG: carboxypeptidase M32 [Abitibacteriaceae bacterium]|nr:carboxypeptidase M32 [Abditibacteriaceae bacterium]MBV9866108.1 carboxypeptidase M32 [Abditibacteriaceae bacterium]